MLSRSTLMHNPDTINGMKYSIKEVNISLIKTGDTIIHNDKMTTVCPKNISHGGFCGKTLFGDSYVMGRVPVKLVVIHKAMPKI